MKSWEWPILHQVSDMIKHEIKKITHFEYWPYWLFYIPFVPVWLWYSIKSGSLFYFTAANPGMKFGGFFNYSKFEIQNQIDSKYRPAHTLWSTDMRDSQNIPFTFPFIAKPDWGERGKKVSKIENEREWKMYLKQNPTEILLQEFVDLPFEFGIFYARMPNEKKGNILSITGKNLLTFYGDGKTSLREFIESDSRAYFNKSYLYMKFHDQQELILPEGEKLILEEIGNHNRGTYFFDRSDLITNELTERMNSLLSPLKGFNFGRLDVRTSSEVDLQKGIFTVLEVNGSNSEATHIYDNKYSLFGAYKEALRHLRIQYQIARQNMKLGHKPSDSKLFMKELWEFIWKEI
ncbi:MAG: D-alanine--D-alanine ligase [Flavobacteriaceae bacterium]|nr:D-alanine--D-alanine ligase [Flavobacteriaceae bacterium]